MCIRDRPDPLRYAISTTDPVDEARIDRLLEQEGDMLSALRRFAREFPYGMNSAGSAVPAMNAIEGLH